jgi:hypothetical protein
MQTGYLGLVEWLSFELLAEFSPLHLLEDRYFRFGSEFVGKEGLYRRAVSIHSIQREALSFGVAAALGVASHV